MNNEENPSVAIAVAIIGVLGLIAVPIVSRLVDIYLPTPVPTTSIQPSQVASPATPITIIIAPTPMNSPIARIHLTATATLITEILPEGVNSVKEMPYWLAANVGGTPDQWQRVQSGKWRFRSESSGGIGDNQILSPRVGYLLFGADSGKRDSNGGVIWLDAVIGQGQATFWSCSEPNKAGAIDSADWFLYYPNIVSCN